MNILYGKPVALQIDDEIITKTAILDIKPRLDIFLIGNNPASEKYVDLKVKKASQLHIDTLVHKYPEDIDEISLLTEIDDLNNSPQVNGIMVQLPLSPKFNTSNIVNKILPIKDVDGLSSKNYANSATANAVIKLLEYYKIDYVNKAITVLGSSITVGIPLSLIFIEKGASVTVCNDKTQNIDQKIQEADLVVSATGVPGIVSANNLKQGSVVIDVGYTLINNEVKGDVNTHGIENIASAISPVPGGVGPVTVSTLLLNTLKAYEQQRYGE